MGIPVEVELPSVTEQATAGSETRDAPFDAWWDREIRFSSDAKRYLISLFSPDRPGVLASVLGGLADGIFLTGRRDKLSFSVDGSLAASIDDTFSAVLVVRVVTSGRAQHAYVRAIPDPVIQQALQQTLVSLVPDVDVSVWPFRHLARDLFAGRRFSEYRFGVNRNERDRLGEVASVFSDRLGELSVPIAFLHFPDESPTEPDQLWLRVGLGFDRGVSSALDVDLEAVRTAEELRCSLKKYDPSIPAGELSGRFRLIGDDRDPVDVPAIADSSLRNDVVFAEGPARPGYVADMLREAPPGVLVGGSMAVLAGHTMATWIVTQGQGPAFKAALAELNSTATQASSTEDVASREEILEGVETTDAVATESQDVWVCWRCGEEPGVLRRVVDAVIAHFGGDGTLVNVEREVSRVLAEGETCAGKMRVSIPRSVADEENYDELTTKLRGVLADALANWAPRRAEWLSRPVKVGEAEPSEDPWASLLV